MNIDNQFSSFIQELQSLLVSTDLGALSIEEVLKDFASIFATRDKALVSKYAKALESCKHCKVLTKSLESVLQSDEFVVDFIDFYYGCESNFEEIITSLQGIVHNWRVELYPVTDLINLFEQTKFSMIYQVTTDGFGNIRKENYKVVK